MAVRETMAAAGYTHAWHDPALGGHVLRDNDTGSLELWVANKDHASYGIVYKNTHLEFVRSVQANR